MIIAKDKYYNLLSFSLAIICFFVILWISNKGIMLPDEGVFYAYLNPNTENYHSVINYDLLFKLLYRYTSLQLGIWESRILRITCFLFVFLLYLYICRKYSFSTPQIGFLFLCVFAGYGIMPQSISYYSLSFIFTSFFIFLYFLFGNNYSKRDAFLYFLQGVLCSLLFLVKPTIGIILLILIFIRAVLFLFQKNKYLFFISLFIPILAFSLFQFWLHVEFPHYSFRGVIEIGNEFQSIKQYSTGYIFEKLFSAVKWSFLLMLCGYLFSKEIIISSKHIILSNTFKYLSAFAIIFVFILQHYGSNKFGISEYSLTSISFVVLGVLIPKIDFYKVSVNELFLYMVLFLMPFVCQFGSNVYFFRICQNFAFFWWLLIFILIHKAGYSFHRFSYLYFVLSGLILFNIYQNHIKWQILSAEKFHKQPFKTEISNKPIFISALQKDYFNSISLLFNKYNNPSNKKYVLGLYQMPGDILFSGGNIFLNPLTWNSESLNTILENREVDQVAVNKVYPLVLSRDVLTAQEDLKSRYGLKLLDSVKHWQSGKVYIFQSSQL